MPDLPASDIFISAVICTHNRDRYLGEAIDSLLHQQGLSGYEVIVVDNASTDRTLEVVEARQPHPQLRYVYEPTLGLSVARNTGARRAKGHILAYLDDDAIASPQWLRTLDEFYRHHDNVAIAGGKVTLIWPDSTTPPRWMTREMSGCLGFYDLGSETVFIKNPGLTPRGLNYSMRRSFWQQMGGFDRQLGRIGTRLLSNEELHMTERAIASGWRVAYVPEALVAHHVAPERLSRAWFLHRSWWQGMSECSREQVSGRQELAQINRGCERLVRGLYRTIKYRSDPALRFDNFVYAYGQIGYLNAVLRGFWVNPD